MRLLPDNPQLGWTPYAWLIYLVPLFLGPLPDPASWELPLASAVTLLFLVLYFRVYWVRGREQLLTTCAVVVLAVLYTPVNPGASTFFIYAAAFFGNILPKRTAWIAMACLLGMLAVETAIFSLPPYSWAPVLVFVPIIGGINVHFREAGRANARLRVAQEEVEQVAKMDERERIARDLHDLLGHTLSVVTLKSELAGRLLAPESGSPDLEAARAEIADIEGLSRRAMSEVRSSVRGYRTHRLQSELAKARMALATAQIHLEVETSPYDLDSDAEPVVALALREAVTNVVRHARALACTIRLRTSASGDFVLEVEDDGRGRHDQEPGAGLQGMRERVEEIGGTVELEDGGRRGILGRGTLLRLRLPRGRDRSGHDQLAVAQ